SRDPPSGEQIHHYRVKKNGGVSSVDESADFALFDATLFRLLAMSVCQDSEQLLLQRPPPTCANAIARALVLEAGQLRACIDAVCLLTIEVSRDLEQSQIN